LPCVVAHSRRLTPLRPSPRTAGKLARLVVQLHGERAHLEPFCGKKASTAANPEPAW
jgi:hypothetical protein